MRVPGGNHVDRTLLLSPASYFDPPSAFGHVESARPHIPVGGDARSMRVALVQHWLVLAWASRGGPPVRELARLFGFSKQTFSKVRLGDRWMGSAVGAALLWSATVRRAGPSDGGEPAAMPLPAPEPHGRRQLQAEGWRR